MTTAPEFSGNTVRGFSRRRLLSQAATTLASGLLSAGLGSRIRAADQKSRTGRDRIRITEIETHQVMVPYHDWIADPLMHFYGPTKRTVYVVHATGGLVGLGESGSPEPQSTIKQYLGSNPFDWIGDETSLGLGTAMYDLMGQIAGVPVYKLFGRRHRRWVPVGSWTVSTDPQHMATAVQKYAERGYTWLKFHLSPFENVFDQLDAMQKVAPGGFRAGFDLTMGGTTDHTPGLLDKMAAYPISGLFEDPLFEKDIDGYIALRKRSKLPIVLHHSPLGFSFDVLRRACDACIVGHAKIGVAMRLAGLFAQANLPFMLQNVGGNITRAMVVHMQSAFKTASLHTHNDTETWKADVVKERLEPVNGLVKVPEKPGLGLTLDREELQRLSNLKLPEQKKWIIRSRFANGTRMYNIADPNDSIFMVRPDRRRLIPMSYASPITTDYWDDDGSDEYRSMFQRIEREGIVLEKGPARLKER